MNRAKRRLCLEINEHFYKFVLFSLFGRVLLEPPSKSNEVNLWQIYDDTFYLLHPYLNYFAFKSFCVLSYPENIFLTFLIIILFQR